MLSPITLSLSFFIAFRTIADAFSHSSDPFKVLGLPRSQTLTRRDVLKAYRKQSLIYHPDKSNSPEAATIFQQLSHSKELLLKLIEFKEPPYNSIMKATENEIYPWIVKSVGVVIVLCFAVAVLPSLMNHGLLKGMFSFLAGRLTFPSFPM